MPKTFEYQNKQQKYYSLGELTGSIRKVLSRTYTGAYWVKTEIAKLNFYPYSGHCYPDLVEKQNNKVVAQIRSTIWAGTYDLISTKFRKVAGEELSEGMTVLLLVKVVYHEQHGLALNILDIEPSFTLGEMAREKQIAIEKLKKEGLFDRNKQLALPLLPKRIAVISVETSKGYHDFLNIIDNNRYGYCFEHSLFPALLQGDHAVDDIVKQLKNIATKSELFDVTVIIRGGGGDVGLSAYDHYKMVKEVATFPLPVITGIGHSTNETVVEMIAFANKITPTDVAYFLIQKFENFHATVYDLEQRLESNTKLLLQNHSKILTEFSNNFQKQIKYLVGQNKSKLFLLGGNLQNHIGYFVKKQKSKLTETAERIRSKPLKAIDYRREDLERKEKILELLVKQSVKTNRSHLAQLENKLELLKPENILKRGYSITYKNGKAVKTTGDVKSGDLIITVLEKGTFESEITKINNK